MPVHPTQDRLRLLSYIWPDQPDRKLRTEAALDLAARHGPLVEQGEAADWAQQRLGGSYPGQVHLMFNTVAWQYFPAETRARILAALAEAGERASDHAPLAHLQVETDGQPRGARITLTLWPGTITLDLGRADFHGRRVDWLDPLG